MLGADPKDELVMPVNKPMQQDHNNLRTGDNNKNIKTNGKRRNEIVIQEALPGG